MQTKRKSGWRKWIFLEKTAFGRKWKILAFLEKNGKMSEGAKIGMIDFEMIERNCSCFVGGKNPDSFYMKKMHSILPRNHNTILIGREL